MVVKGKDFDDIFDLVGIRVVVDRVEDCYAALGSIHATWKPVQGRIKDYIAMPKFNLYQSLHTTVVGPQGKPLEVQIRTREMHRRAEYGVAAHWAYKDAELSSSDIAWLNRIVDWQSETDDPNEFMETLRVDLDQDEVFVFTPKGKVVTLPDGATPIDFAYAIHTEVGHACIGARVNGRLQPLDSKLDSGDTVEIFTSKVEGGPSRDWLNIAASPRARNKIRQWFSRERREDAMETGPGRADQGAAPGGPARSRSWPSRNALADLATKLSYADLDAMYVAIGENHVSAKSIAQRLARELRSGERRGAAADHGPAPRRRRADLGRARRGARRRDGAPGPLLHARAGRRDHGLRHPGPGRLGAPDRLRQRQLAAGRAGGPPHRGRVELGVDTTPSSSRSRSRRSTAAACSATSRPRWPTTT